MTRHTARCHWRFFRKSTRHQYVPFSSASQEALTACNSRLMHFIQVAQVGLASTTGHGYRPADWSISVMFANGLKRRFHRPDYPPMFATGTCIHPHVETPRQASGVQHAADMAVSAWFYRPRRCHRPPCCSWCYSSPEEISINASCWR